MSVEGHELSTGQSVELPLSTEVAMCGALFPAARDPLVDVVPDGMAPLRLTAESSLVALVSAEYRRIAAAGIEPYGEFLVVVPVVRDNDAGCSLCAAGLGDVMGYVWYMPVTTQTAFALGREVWGFPKVVAAIDFEEQAERRRTTVSIEGREFITLDVGRPPTVDGAVSLTGCTVRDGRLLRERLELDGEIAVSLSNRHVSYTLGDHPAARRLQSFDLASSPLVQFSFDGTFVIHAGEPIAGGAPGSQSELNRPSNGELSARGASRYQGVPLQAGSGSEMKLAPFGSGGLLRDTVERRFLEVFRTRATLPRRNRSQSLRRTSV